MYTVLIKSDDVKEEKWSICYDGTNNAFLTNAIKDAEAWMNYPKEDHESREYKIMRLVDLAD